MTVELDYVVLAQGISYVPNTGMYEEVLVHVLLVLGERSFSTSICPSSRECLIQVSDLALALALVRAVTSRIRLVACSHACTRQSKTRSFLDVCMDT